MTRESPRQSQRGLGVRTAYCPVEILRVNVTKNERFLVLWEPFTDAFTTPLTGRKGGGALKGYLTVVSKYYGQGKVRGVTMGERGVGLKRCEKSVRLRTAA